MTMTTVTIPNLKIQLTTEQLITAVRQLNLADRTKLAQALAETELDLELTQLIADLYSQPAITSISDEEIQAEIQAVRQHRA
jgi:hypothetical protein